MTRTVMRALAMLALLAGPAPAQDFILPEPEAPEPAAPARAAPTERSATPRRAVAAARAAPAPEAPRQSRCELLAGSLAGRRDLDTLAASGAASQDQLVLAMRQCAVENQMHPQDTRTAFLYGSMLQATGNEAGALKVYADLSVAGHPPATTRLGDFYYWGRAGLAARPGQGCTLWTRAAKAGDPLALPKAGSCLVAAENPVEQRQMGCQFLVDAERANLLDDASRTLRQTTCAAWR